MANCVRGTLEYQSSYYYIGQVTRFVRPGARRIVSASTLDELETTAFLNPDDSIAVIVMNRTGRDASFGLKYGDRVAQAESPAHSISTFSFQKC